MVMLVAMPRTLFLRGAVRISTAGKRVVRSCQGDQWGRQSLAAIPVRSMRSVTWQKMRTLRRGAANRITNGGPIASAHHGMAGFPCAIRFARSLHRRAVARLMSAFTEKGDWVREKGERDIRSPITKCPCENSMTDSDPCCPCPVGRITEMRICGGGVAMAWKACSSASPDGQAMLPSTASRRTEWGYPPYMPSTCRRIPCSTVSQIPSVSVSVSAWATQPDMLIIIRIANP